MAIARSPPQGRKEGRREGKRKPDFFAH